MAALVPSINDLPTGHDVLRVTTFNILAPVWTHSSIYPGMDMQEFEPSARRERLLRMILELDSDIVFMQECQRSELDELLQLDGGALQKTYDVEFCPFPLTFWTNWLTDTTNYEPRENGVCMLTKKVSVHKVKAEHVPIDLPSWKDELPEHALGAHACFVWVEVPRWEGATALLVTSHLDADSGYRAGLQGVELAKKIKERASVTDCKHVIWGGDFNMEVRNSAISGIKQEGFVQASGAVEVPTVYAVPGTVRVDHVFFYRQPAAAQANPAAPLRDDDGGLAGAPPLQALATFVKRCPLGHIFGVLPLLSELQWLACTAQGERGLLLRIVTCLFLLVFSPLLMLIFSPVLIHRCDRPRQCQRLSWALEYCGSDHLPVTVVLKRS
mmetsp:Transcript_37421/g.106897  ORF Transcript_37421/g.106897 Transcript_37421/m.106897 type:complete len:384 (-) Transcript_37421:92-1243(-)